MTKIKNPKNAKTSIQAFRADKELTRLLNNLPHKTEFIIDALFDSFSKQELVTCKRCKGTGKIRKKKK